MSQTEARIQIAPNAESTVLRPVTAGIAAATGDLKTSSRTKISTGIAIRSAYRSSSINAFGNERGYNCARNEANYAGHIWDRRDDQGRMGATACIVIPWFADLYEGGREWQALAWWVHDHLPYSSMEFFGKRAAFNLNWRERPDREIYGQVAPKGYLTRPGMVGHQDDHSASYGDFPVLRTA